MLAIQITPQFLLLAEACDGREAIDLALRLQPDLMLIDLIMPDLNGVVAIRAIKQHLPSVRIIALTSYADTNLVLSAMQAGADGYLLKDIEAGELIGAITCVQRGLPYLHADATRHLLQAASRSERSAPLTDREQQVLGLVARGYSNQQIATALCISEKTVSVHISNVLRKLQLVSRTQAALYAVQTGLLPMLDSEPVRTLVELP